MPLGQCFFRCLARHHRGAPQAMMRRQFSRLPGRSRCEWDKRQMWEAGGRMRILKRASVVVARASHSRCNFGYYQRGNNDRVAPLLNLGKDCQALRVAFLVWIEGVHEDARVNGVAKVP
jgi:hypothetical protein